jgi:hypothetical protein
MNRKTKEKIKKQMTRREEEGNSQGEEKSRIRVKENSQR